MSKKPDSEFTARTLLALRDDIQTQAGAAHRICMMFNSLAGEYGIEPVIPSDGMDDAVDPLILREYAARRALDGNGIRLERTSGDNRRYQVLRRGEHVQADGYNMTLEDVEAFAAQPDYR